MKRTGWTELTSLTTYWKLFGIHRFRKLQAQQGARLPDGKRAVGSLRATEMGKLHFAQSHTFSTDPNYYFHSSQVIQGWEWGWIKGAWGWGEGKGWAERARTCPYFVSLLLSPLNKSAFLFSEKGSLAPHLTALNVVDLVPTKPSSARQLNPGQHQHRREREIVPFAQLKHFILLLGLKTLIWPQKPGLWCFCYEYQIPSAELGCSLPEQITLTIQRNVYRALKTLLSRDQNKDGGVLATNLTPKQPPALPGIVSHWAPLFSANN